MIMITGTVVVAPEDREAMIALGREQVLHSRAEAGCLAYHVYEDALEPGRFTFVEQWRDQAAVDIHFAQPYSGAFVRGARAIARNTPAITLHDVAGVRTLTPRG